MSDIKPVVPRKAYEKYVERCPKMTMRWRRDLLHEVAAWLVLQRVRVERQALHVAAAAKEGGGPDMKDALTKLHMRMSVYEDLIRQLPDKWSEYMWWEVVGIVEDTVGRVGTRPDFTPRIPGMVATTTEPPANDDGSTGRGDAGASVQTRVSPDKRRRRRD